MAETLNLRDPSDGGSSSYEAVAPVLDAAGNPTGATRRRTLSPGDELPPGFAEHLPEADRAHFINPVRSEAAFRAAAEETADKGKSK